MQLTVYQSLSNLFKDSLNENSYNLLNTSKNKYNIKLNLANEFLMYDKVFYRNYDISDKIVYETSDKLLRIEIGNPSLCYKTYTINTKYRRNCIKRYKKRNLLNKRIYKINCEILRINAIKNKIKNDVI